MSPFYIKEFRKTHKCNLCEDSVKDGRHFCREHLEEARLKWQLWAVTRRAEGKCCFCGRKSFNGWLRCRKHTMINRERCRAWMKLHGHQVWLDVKAETLRTGLCQHCRNNRPVIPGTLGCLNCKRRHQERYNVHPN
jgi:hypothetical protein